MSENNPPADHAIVDEVPEKEQEASAIEENLKSRSTWLRLIFMVIFYFLASLASVVASFVVVLGFFWVLFTGETNRHLQQAGQGIASYIYQIIRYLTYNSDDKPFPFGADWPGSSTEEPVAPTED